MILFNYTRLYLQNIYKYNFIQIYKTLIFKVYINIILLKHKKLYF